MFASVPFCIFPSHDNLLTSSLRLFFQNRWYVNLDKERPKTLFSWWSKAWLNETQWGWGICRYCSIVLFEGLPLWLLLSLLLLLVRGWTSKWLQLQGLHLCYFAERMMSHMHQSHSYSLSMYKSFSLFALWWNISGVVIYGPSKLSTEISLLGHQFF